MKDSQQGKNKGKGKSSDNYELWTKEESDCMLELLVDGISRGWRETNGVIPRLNEKTMSPKTYNNIVSRMRWYKRQFDKMTTLMRNNFGFGWDPITNKFTASDEVWENYLKSHPSHKNLQTESVANYDDLKIMVGGATATGNGSLALGVNDTDATTFRDEEKLKFGMEGFIYDAANETFVAPSFEAPQGKTSQNKRSRSEYEGSSNSIGSTNQAKVLETISTNFEKIYVLMEKRQRNRENSIWDAMKDVPNLDDNVQYKLVELLNTKVKQDMFLKMSPEERSSWISFKLG
ncbi:hypothetical protein PRUPE_8G061600 [Prunus persica]|uniref:Uncharacterized protein n=1 Tax=Prunus persica TaxID=3760 RepID=A0A251MU02_PRUPE|nr:hypothetical protein PRUPE_8G061600 [Prunus persica]